MAPYWFEKSYFVYNTLNKYYTKTFNFPQPQVFYLRNNTIHFKIMIVQKELVAYEEYFKSVEGCPSKGFLILKTGERVEIPVTDLELCNLQLLYRN